MFVRKDSVVISQWNWLKMANEIIKLDYNPGQKLWQKLGNPVGRSLYYPGKSPYL